MPEYHDHRLVSDHNLPLMPGPASVEKTPCEPLEICCPACQAENVTAEVWEVNEVFKIFAVIPIFRRRFVFLRCSSCRAQLQAGAELETLYDLSPEDLRDVIRPRLGIVRVVLLITAATLWWLPLIGLVFTVLAVIGNRRPPRWTSILSRTTLVLALIINAWVVYELVTG